MVADGVGGDAQLFRELLGGERLRPLQLAQHLAPKSFVCRKLRVGIHGQVSNPKGLTRDCQLNQKGLVRIHKWSLRLEIRRATGGAPAAVPGPQRSRFIAPPSRWY